jgi:hypothetical protein
LRTTALRNSTVELRFMEKRNFELLCSEKRRAYAFPDLWKKINDEGKGDMEGNNAIPKSSKLSIHG